MITSDHLRGFVLGLVTVAACVFIYANWGTGSDWLFVLGLIALALVIPPKYDPAIRLKEWLQRHRR